MSDVVYCNEEQAEKILRTYFSIPPIVTKVSKDDAQYFIKALTIPGLHRTEWQYRNWQNYNTGRVIRACFGEIHKGSRRYDLNGTYSDELMSSINKSFEQAIDHYERGCDIFQSEGVRYTKGFFKNIFYNLTKSPKRKYLWTVIILSILLLLSLTSCDVQDSIQNYVGSEVIDIRNIQIVNQSTYYIVKIRTKDIGIKNHKPYKIVEIKCYDAQGYQPGDTIKIRKFPK